MLGVYKNTIKEAREEAAKALRRGFNGIEQVIDLSVALARKNGLPSEVIRKIVLEAMADNTNLPIGEQLCENNFVVISITSTDIKSSESLLEIVRLIANGESAGDDYNDKEAYTFSVTSLKND